MAEHCKNCGTELLAGQRFCRMCGASISESQREELPTKIFQGERQKAAGPQTHTAPQSAKPGTDPFSPFQQGTAPQTPHPPAPQSQFTTPLYMPPDQKPSSSSRATMFIIIGIVCLTVLAAVLLSMSYRHAQQTRATTPQAESGIPVPPEPPEPPAGEGAGTTVLDESDAINGDHETTITKTYPLANSATFLLKGINGNVQIEGWDEAEAEVRVIKRGGSVEDRQAAQVKATHSNDLLSLETVPTGAGGVDVRYEVKLPRGLRHVQIKTVNAGVKVADMAGTVEVKAQNASVELEDVSGASIIKLVNGQIKASYDDALTGSQELSTVNGKIEVELDDDLNADIDAHTVSGSIELDGDFGFKVDKKIVGQEASGRVGSGGQPISVKTVNGPIVIAR